MVYVTKKLKDNIIKNLRRNVLDVDSLNHGKETPVTFN
jgi:hypothetical protein